MLREVRNSYYRPGGRHRIVDDRGKIVPLCTAADVPGDADFELRYAIDEGNRHRWGPFLAEYAVLAVIATVFCAFLGLVRVWAAFLTLMPIALFVTSALNSRAAGIRAIKACHAAGRCPSCCYDLTHIAPEADGRTVCPECGGAWKRGDTNEPPLPRG